MASAPTTSNSAMSPLNSISPYSFPFNSTRSNNCIRSSAGTDGSSDDTTTVTYCVSSSTNGSVFAESFSASDSMDIIVDLAIVFIFARNFMFDSNAISRNKNIRDTCIRHVLHKELGKLSSGSNWNRNQSFLFRILAAAMTAPRWNDLPLTMYIRPKYDSIGRCGQLFCLFCKLIAVHTLYLGKCDKFACVYR